MPTYTGTRASITTSEAVRSYATVAELRQHLVQVAATVENEALLQKTLDRATQIVDDFLGFSFAGYASSATARAVWCEGREYLRLPWYDAATAPIVRLAGETITTWEADPDSRAYLIYTSEAGVSSALEYWTAGRYYVTAKWGYGDPPEDVVEITLQVALRLWAKDNLNTVTTDGGTSRAARWLTYEQRDVLDAVRARYGVWGIG